MRKFFALNLAILLMAMALDQIAKGLAVRFFTIVKNEGLFLNSLEDLPSNVKIMALSTFAGLVFFFYLALTYLMNTQLRSPRHALSLLMAGILSNTLDKVIFGYTLDFIPLGHYAFNLADVMTLGSVVYLVAYMGIYHPQIWSSDDNRRRIFINPRAQIMFGVKYAIVTLCTSFFLGLLSLTFIKNYVLPVVLTSSQNLISMFIVLHISMTLAFSVIVFVVGVLVSHRFVGPIVALERFVEELQKGHSPHLNLRQGDYFKQIEELGRKIREIKKGSDVD